MHPDPHPDPCGPGPQPSRRRLSHALLLSACLHLALLLLIRPAPWPAGETVMLQARLHPGVSPHRPGPPPPPPAQPLPTAAATAGQATGTRSAPPLPPETPADPQATPDEHVAPDAGAQPPSPEPAEVLPQIPVPFDTRWYTAREVDSRPQPLGDVLPTYPEEARALGLTGSVLVALHIDETGEVRAIEILESHPPGVFDEAVRAAYAQARFLPAFRAGRAVRYVGKYRVLFELD